MLVYDPTSGTFTDRRVRTYLFGVRLRMLAHDAAARTASCYMTGPAMQEHLHDGVHPAFAIRECRRAA